MLISLQEEDNRPLYQQIVNQIKDQVNRELLQPGDELPSVRELAESLSVNMHTVRRAYLELRDQGIISLRLGRRAKIVRQPHTAPTQDTGDAIRGRFSELVTDAALAGFSAEEIRQIIEDCLKR